MKPNFYESSILSPKYFEQGVNFAAKQGRTAHLLPTYAALERCLRNSSERLKRNESDIQHLSVKNSREKRIAISAALFPTLTLGLAFNFYPDSGTFPSPTVVAMLLMILIGGLLSLNSLGRMAKYSKAMRTITTKSQLESDCMKSTESKMAVVERAISNIPSSDNEL